MTEFEFMSGQQRDYADRIIALLQREKSIDLTMYDIPVRVFVREVPQGDAYSEAAFSACVRDYFVDGADYLDAQTFALHLMPMCGDPDGPESPHRQMGELYRLEVHREGYMKVPYIPMLGLNSLMHALEELFGVRKK